MLVPVVLFVLLVVGASSDVVIINDIVDQLLKSVRMALILKGSNRVPLKPLEKTFKTNLFVMKIPGRFTAKDGYLEGLATAHRTGDAVMRTQGNVLKLEASLGIERLHVFYAQYRLEYFAFAPSGTMDVTMTNSAVTAALTVSRNGTQCNVVVDKAEVDSLGETKVLLSGGKVLNRFITLLLNWIIRNFKDTFKDMINTEMSEGLQSALNKTDPCSKLPHLFG